MWNGDISYRETEKWILNRELEILSKTSTSYAYLLCIKSRYITTVIYVLLLLLVFFNISSFWYDIPFPFMTLSHEICRSCLICAELMKTNREPPNHHLSISISLAAISSQNTEIPSCLLLVHILSSTLLLPLPLLSFHSMIQLKIVRVRPCRCHKLTRE